MVATASEMARRGHEVLVVNAGNPSQVLAGSGLAYVEHPFTGKMGMTTFRNVYITLLKFDPEVIHAFDTAGYLFGRLFAGIKKRKIILTKCGGPNPRLYYPLCGDLIVYSHENYEYFQKYKRPWQRLLYLPHRVSDVPQNRQRITALMKKIDPCRFTFLRVTRIGRIYEETIRRSMHFVSRLNDAGLSTQLIIVGHAQESRVADRLRKASDSHTYIITNDDFTINASSIIDCADAVIGTGRGLMEAACRGRMLFAFAANQEYPVLVTRQNFECFLRANWSMRAYCADDQVAPVSEVLSIIADPSKVDEQKRFAQWLNDQYFNINTAATRLSEVYADVRVELPLFRHFADFVMNWFSICKTFNHKKHVS